MSQPYFHMVNTLSSHCWAVQPLFFGKFEQKIHQMVVVHFTSFFSSLHLFYFRWIKQIESSCYWQPAVFNSIWFHENKTFISMNIMSRKEQSIDVMWYCNRDTMLFRFNGFSEGVSPPTIENTKSNNKNNNSSGV